MRMSMRQRRRGFWLLPVAAVLLLGAWPSGNVYGQGRGATLRIALGTDVSIFDAARATGLQTFGIINQVTETLVLLDHKGRPVPHLATSWSLSKDGRTWTIKLRPGIKFTDGTPFDAAAVKFNIERMRQLSPGRAAVGMVTGVSVVDDTTVAIHTEGGTYQPLIATLAYGPMAMNSPAAVQRLGDRYGTPEGGAAGTGPFRFVSWRRGQEIRLEVNREYWGGAPKLEAVVMRVIPDTGARIIALESGDVDLIHNVPPADATRLSRTGRFAIINPPSVRVLRLYLNNSWGSLQDKKVRQAVCFAINRDAIIRNLFQGLGKASDSPVPSAAYGYVSIPTYKYNLIRARALLRDSGLPQGFEMTLHYAPGRWLLDNEIVEAMQADLARVGIRVRVVAVDFATLATLQRRPAEQSPLQATFNGWAAANMDADRAIQDFAVDSFPPNGQNLSFYSNKDVDRLIAFQQRTINGNARLFALKRIQEMVMADSPACFLYEQPIIWAVKAGVKNVDSDATEVLYPLVKAEVGP